MKYSCTIEIGVEKKESELDFDYSRCDKRNIRQIVENAIVKIDEQFVKLRPDNYKISVKSDEENLFIERNESYETKDGKAGG